MIKDVQEMPIPVDELGREIVAKIKKADTYQAKVDQDQEKADAAYKSAGLLLVEARRQMPKKFLAFLSEHCPGLSHSRAFELIAVAEGRTTCAAIRAKANARKRRHRKKKKATLEEKLAAIRATLLPQLIDEGWTPPPETVSVPGTETTMPMALHLTREAFSLARGVKAHLGRMTDFELDAMVTAADQTAQVWMDIADQVRKKLTAPEVELDPAA